LCLRVSRTASTSRPHCESQGQLRIEHDHHLFGVFRDATWRRLIEDSGLERVDVDDPMQTSTLCSLVGVPPAEKFRRQVEAG
jgi:hypothetical protein